MESTTIKALFGRRNIRFVIPAYQRAYAWEKRQFIQFIEDLGNVKFVIITWGISYLSKMGIRFM